MNSASAHFVPSRRMGIYEPLQQLDMWGDFKGHNCLDGSALILDVDAKLDYQSEDTTSHGTVGPSNNSDPNVTKPDKVKRRLAQNREAARKSRLRKKAYVQQLENSKLKLIQIEQELDRARRQQSMYSGPLDTSHLSSSLPINPAITKFEMDYGLWVEEHDRQISDLRSALNSEMGETELQIFVESGIKHYFALFTMKATAAKSDVSYVMSGLWKTSAERFFLWIGGFRPSELLKVLLPHLEPMTTKQRFDVENLRQSCQQFEDALSQGMEKLQGILCQTISAGRLGDGNYLPQLGGAIENLESLVRFVDQADQLRQQTLQQMSRYLSPHQAARGLLALGEYMIRLRALSSLWSSRPRVQ